MKENKHIIIIVISVLLCFCFIYLLYKKTDYKKNENIVYSEIKIQDFSEEEKKELTNNYNSFLKHLGEEVDRTKIGKEVFFQKVKEIQNSNSFKADIKTFKDNNLDVTEIDLGFNLSKILYKEENNNFVKLEIYNIYDFVDKDSFDPYFNEELIKEHIKNSIISNIPDTDISNFEYLALMKEINDIISYKDIKQLNYKFNNYGIRFLLKPVDNDVNKAYLVFEINKL